MSKIKLKSLLEGFSWEREPGKPLPTLGEVQKKYEESLNEQTSAEKWILDIIGFVKKNKPVSLKDRSTAELHEMLELIDSNLLDIIGFVDSDQIKRKTKTLIQQELNRRATLNELSDEEIDARWNTPQQMGQRIRNTHYKYGEKPKPTKNPAYADAQRREISRFYQEKLAAAEAERQQLMFDMEQEAEPEGGPIADYYGEQLEILDKKIESIRKRMSV